MSGFGVGDTVMILPSDAWNDEYRAFKPGDVGIITAIGVGGWFDVKIEGRPGQFFAAPTELGSPDDPEFLGFVRERIVQIVMKE